ncbi:hypothetical protein G7Y89_g14761 [Cudoniella acicularis]|uniref:Uncharacterized protein n=1 Tax=Cudoniella acicularis TaxID=354080 RepID=A0A8H4QYN1_9HELO|nr:hypothetical protein G7Y89_g14761 [Cudoniella acicularis]
MLASANEMRGGFSVAEMAGSKVSRFLDGADGVIVPGVGRRAPVRRAGEFADISNTGVSMSHIFNQMEQNTTVLALSADFKSPVVTESSMSSPQSLKSPQPLSLPRFQESYITDADTQHVITLLTQQRAVDGKSKKSKKEVDVFSYKEVNAVLNSAVSNRNSPASPGLVQALLKHGADVSVARRKSTNFFKKIIKRDQEDRRSDVLAQATQNCQLEVVWILTKQADDFAKTEALPFAIQQNDTAKARVLLDAGADAATFHTEFLSAIEKNGADDMVETLILANEKGPYFDNGAALQKAIEAGREDLANAIATCENKPSPKSFDIAVALAYAKLAHDPEKQHRMIETCIQGGARGSNTDEILHQTAKFGQTALTDLLLASGASVDHQEGAALRHAITSEQPALLTTLLRGKPSPSTLATIIPATMTLSNPAVTYESIDHLLSAGLQGNSVAETLITIVNRSSGTTSDSEDLRLIQLLLEKGEADINFDGGKSIRLAATAGNTALLKLLLPHNPSVESLNAAFPLAMQLQDAAWRLEVVTMILQAGATGKVIDDALLESASTGKDGVKLTSVLLSRSSVDYENGKALCNAIKSRSLEQIKALMEGGPSGSTLNAGWVEADALQDDEFQYQAFQVLLDAGADQTLKNSSLITAATRGQRGIPVCRLLLQHQASPDYSNGASIVGAAKGLHLDTLHLLAGAVTTPSVFTVAFDAFTDGDEWLAPKWLEIVHFLLENGALGQEVDAAFCKAARLFDADAVELLVNSVNTEVLGLALVTATQAGKDWLSIDNLWLVHSLLEWGAAGECVNIIFLEALDAYARGFTSEDLVDTFLHVGAGADVNFQNGEALQIAAKFGNGALIEKLAACRATRETLTLAFSVAIISGHEEKQLNSVIDAFMRNEGTKPDFTSVPDGFQPLLFACLLAYPQSAALVKRLMKLGCSLESQIEHYPYDDEEFEAENVTVLAWAISQPENRIASASIDALIDGKADVSFTTKVSRVTPLILAAKYSRIDVVKKLIKHKAKTTAKDIFDRSALFYASRIGDVESVEALALVKAKHHPDFPSSKEQHEGRTALQELCLMCDGAKGSTRIEETIQALVDGKASPLEQSRRKNALFLALDNANPLPATRALLDGLMWKHMTSEENVYVEVDPETGTKYFFSPTTYVARGFSQGPVGDNERLLRLLEDKRGVDRYYAEEGAEQPPDAVGQPQAIIDAEKKRRTREEKLRQQQLDHELALLRERQAADHKAEIERAKHEEKMFREQELAQQRMALQEQGDAQKLQAAQTRAQFDEMQKQRLAQQKLAAQQQEQELKLRFGQQAAQQKLAVQARQNQLAAAASQQKLITQQRMAEGQARAAQQKLTIKARQDQQALRFMHASAKEKQYTHNMQMAELSAKAETMKLTMMNKHFSAKQKRIAAG